MTFRRENQRGVALLIVLSVITVLTVITMQFFYVSSINRSLAKNEKSSYQAELLAESGVSMTRLQIALWKRMKAQVVDAAGNAAIAIDLNTPFCQQYPELMSTDLLRTIFSGGSVKAPKKEESGGGEEGDIADVNVGGDMFGISGFDKEKAEKFLKFEGNFIGTCSDESAKFNLNMFYGKDPKRQVLSGYNDYDEGKLLLASILLRPEFKLLFPEAPEEKVAEIATNIADWVDSNSEINELGATTRGNESALYPPGVANYDVKNGKFLSLPELSMVAGVEDSWLIPLITKSDILTVYGGDKINVCVAPDEVVAALIVQYANENQKVPDIKPDDKEKIDMLVNVVKNSCAVLKPNVNDIAKALDSAIGVAIGGTDSSTTSSSSGFANMITTESRFYKIVGVGTAGNSTVQITAVLDAGDSDPKRWKYVYWKVE